MNQKNQITSRQIVKEIIEELRAVADDAIHVKEKGYYDSRFLFWLVKCRVRWEFSPRRPHPAAVWLFIAALLFYLVMKP